jgi:hypothetical protein
MQDDQRGGYYTNQNTKVITLFNKNFDFWGVTKQNLTWKQINLGNSEN